MGFLEDGLGKVFKRVSSPFRHLFSVLSGQTVEHKELKWLFAQISTLADHINSRYPDTITFDTLRSFPPYDSLPQCMLIAVVRPDVNQFNTQNPYSPEKNKSHALRFDIFTDPATATYINVTNPNYRVVMYSRPTPYKYNDGQSETEIIPEQVVSEATLSVNDIKSLMASLPAILISDSDENKTLIEMTFHSLISPPQRLADYSGFPFQVIDTPPEPQEPEPR